MKETPEQWVHYNVWGDHSFSYTSETMPHLASMRVQPNGKKVPEKRLMRLQDDRERIRFVDIDWYELGDVLEAIEKKKAKTFKTCNIKAAQEQLREHNVTFYNQYMDPLEVVKALSIHVSKKRLKTAKRTQPPSGSSAYLMPCACSYHRAQGLSARQTCISV